MSELMLLHQRPTPLSEGKLRFGLMDRADALMGLAASS